MNQAQSDTAITEQARVIIEHLRATVVNSEEIVRILGCTFSVYLAGHFNEVADEVALLDFLNRFKSTTLDNYTKISN